MAKLVLSVNGNLIDQRFVDQPLLRIGRGADNDIVIADAAVRDHHASILCVGEDHILNSDLAGDELLVNGRPTRRHIFQHLDTVQFGNHHLRYMNTRAARDDLDLTMIVKTLDLRENKPVIAEVGHVRGSKVHFAEGHVRVLRQADTGTAGAAIALDRVVTTFGTPGRELFVLTRRPHGIFASEVDGNGKLRINRRALSERVTALRDGDLIEGAGWLLEFRLGPRAE
jgi:hypothetical protein